MGIIEIDKLDTLLVRHAELKVAVDAFGQTLNEVQRYANETNIVVKDILTGRQISAWVDDLAASGKNSATYKDASRMNALLDSKDACRNNKVSQHIFDFAVANNKTGTYFGTALDNAGGVSWATLTTPASVCGNTAAFALIAKDEIAFDACVGNNTFTPFIYKNAEALEKSISGSPAAIKAFEKRKVSLGSLKVESPGPESRSANGFYLYVEWCTYYCTVKNNGIVKKTVEGAGIPGGVRRFDCFGTSVEISGNWSASSGNVWYFPL